jgi:hypothetical protein
MIRRWLMALLETEIRALVRDEVDLYLLELGLDDRLTLEGTALGLISLDEVLAKAGIDRADLDDENC